MLLGALLVGLLCLCAFLIAIVIIIIGILIRRQRHRYSICMLILDRVYYVPDLYVWWRGGVVAG